MITSPGFSERDKFRISVFTAMSIALGHDVVGGVAELVGLRASVCIVCSLHTYLYSIHSYLCMASHLQEMEFVTEEMLSSCLAWLEITHIHNTMKPRFI